MERINAWKTYENKDKKELEQLNHEMEALRSDSQEQALKRLQMEGHVIVLNEQILAGVQIEDHYQGRLASIEEELSGKIRSIKELLEEKSDLRAQ